MKFLIIYADPNPQGVNARMKAAFIEGLDKDRHTFTLVDLYAENFNPVYTADELLNKKIYPDVARYQELIRSADFLVFFSPTWWYGEPAILKGFFDRVWTSNFAFNYGKMFGLSYPVCLLKGKRALWFKTMNSPWWWYWLGMGNWMIRNIKRGTLGFCGIKVRAYRIYSIIFKKDPAILEKEIAKIKKLASKL